MNVPLDLQAVPMPRLAFDSDDAQRAYDAWGCNCGPAALAFALGKTPDEVRPFLGPFEQRGYMNVTMMREAIPKAGGQIVRTYQSWPVQGIGLVRIQWGGPWIINGRPARWAATNTHWVATWRSAGSWLYVFDINGGLMLVDQWESEVASRIIASIKRADGKWTISHSWEVARYTNEEIPY